MTLDEIIDQDGQKLDTQVEMTLSDLAAKYAIRTASAAYFPTLNITFGLGSFYSSNAKETVLDTILFDIVPLYTYGDQIPMWTQFSNNFGKTLSFSLTVPIACI